MRTRSHRLTAISLMAALLLTTITSHASDERIAQVDRQSIDVVIALDVSSSMSGLIDSAKQRLWDIVSEFGEAGSRPDLRLAILSFGNPGYGSERGYVRIDQPFTRDLDAVNATLFGFGTNGGDEYVARAIHTAVEKLDWSQQSDAMRIIFVAGNEGAEQDPAISIENAIRGALDAGVVVSTIYCGSENDNIAAGWQRIATATNGFFASIDQQAAAVANVAAPQDERLALLNAQLNETYIAFGEKGEASRDNQAEQDANAESMSPSALASRAVVKAGNLYRSADWDLVDAVGEGARLDSIEAEALPEEMQTMSKSEQADYVESMAQKRAELTTEIQKLGAERAAYIAEQRRRDAKGDDKALDSAMREGIRQIAAAKGIRLGSE